jgi:ADP-ribosyl-[dinitrogen reductase] hydrolase
MKEFQIATLIGCAIGDALGNPFETKPAISPLLTEWDGLFKSGGTFWRGDAGQYTDDTLMSIGLATSIIKCGGFDPEDVSNEYLEWYLSGNTRGIGSTTATALENLKLGSHWQTSGLQGEQYGGNGTAMRASPIGLAYRHRLDLVFDYAKTDAIITHNSLEPQMGSVAVAIATAILADAVTEEKFFSKGVKSELIKQILPVLEDSNVKSKLESAQAAIDEDMDPVQSLAAIGSSGYVPETVGAAFYCFMKTSSFEDAVVMAVKAGGDTDTTAAVVGALAGTYYGMEGIPDKYKTVENFDLLDALDKELININE